MVCGNCEHATTPPTQPNNINDRGEIVGLYTLDDESQGFPTLGFHRDRDGEYTTIEYPGALATLLWGLNEQGDIVGSYIPSDTFLSTPFILDRHGKFAIIETPGDGDAAAIGINNRGTISGWFVSEDGLIPRGRALVFAFSQARHRCPAPSAT